MEISTISLQVFFIENARTGWTGPTSQSHTHIRGQPITVDILMWHSEKHVACSFNSPESDEASRFNDQEMEGREEHVKHCQWDVISKIYKMGNSLRQSI